ncbi:hypothetical protein C1701_18480 [Actinoalloteichus sp. AHMU CJ021]|uniref:Dienelactone hydrolase n=1 Tax=Actinoalloteichus caeruleus DSM 43889 TaxID=1120930 RepID=A0ABT1JNS6_ACTCY|nr:acyl-CoA thioesterase/bile acid-CoA:amino acid N-acyltransferase family protein [Actinoalloteichus caeruleus]AUS79994.1 hypothetical protein C1701_18480 [Actinoalloteichus sp. AHMU CJ021]MCP2334179.1 Dienelactone hydrolase [Actinoalloteichus caeruleus DSM 43889]
MELEIDPLDGLVDRCPAVRVRANPHVGVKLEVSVTDAAGHDWGSLNTFGADVSGLVDTARDEPLVGTYEGVDPTGPWWSMSFTNRGTAPTDFVSSADWLDYRVVAQAGRVTETRWIRRRWAADGVERRELNDNGVRLTVFTPAGDEPAPGVLVVPGFAGEAAIQPRAALLASHGYVAAVVDYLPNGPGPPHLVEIPVEVVTTGLSVLARQPRVAADRVGVYASSVGTEGAFAALALTDHEPVRCVVAISPSSVIWQASSGEGPSIRTSSWSHRGEPLPWVRVHANRLLPEMLAHAIRDRVTRYPRPSALHLRSSYAAGLRDYTAVSAARIPVERVRCPLLLISGEDDQLWPAPDMAATILHRRDAHGVGEEDENIVFPDAGHFLRPPLVPTTAAWNENLVSGGSAAGTASADRAGWEASLRFLRRHLGA